MRTILAALLALALGFGPANAGFPFTPAFPFSAKAAGGGGGGGITHVQSPTFVASTSGNNATATFPAIASGDAVAITVEGSGQRNLNTVVDNGGTGNTYTVVSLNTGWSTFPVSVYLVTGVNITGSPTQLTFEFNNTPGTVQGGFDEFSGAHSVNATVALVENDAANPAQSITTTAANAMLDSVMWTTNTTPGPPAGYIQGFFQSASGGVTAYKLVTTATSYTTTWSQSAFANVLGTVAFAP